MSPLVVTDRLLGAADLVISDDKYKDADFIIHCGSDGMFTGKIIADRMVLFKTEKRPIFKKALRELLELCYQEIGDL